MAGYRSLDEMFYNLITTLSLICCGGKNYCFCEKYKKPGDIICLLCYIPFFYNFREDLHQNCTGIIFLISYRNKLFPLLNILSLLLLGHFIIFTMKMVKF